MPQLDARTYRSVAVAALVALIVIIVTGGAVRLSESGLGCSDWPQCEPENVLPNADGNAWIEFGNRLFTGVVSAAVIAAVLGARRRTPHRRDLERWAWGLVAGVLAQIVLGALLVRSHLDPRLTLGHFVLSMILVWNAVVLVHRAGEPHQRLRAVAPQSTILIARLTTAIAVVVVATGTLVTGSGPHGGDEAAERLSFTVQTVARIHAGAVWLLVGALVVAWYDRRRREVWSQRRLIELTVVVLAQGAVGYVQYFTGVPALLVGVHILGAALVWTAALRHHLDHFRATPAQPDSPAAPSRGERPSVTGSQ